MKKNKIDIVIEHHVRNPREYPYHIRIASVLNGGEISSIIFDRSWYRELPGAKGCAERRKDLFEKLFGGNVEVGIHVERV